MDIKILEDVGWGYSKLAVVVDSALNKLGEKYELHIIGNPNLFSDYNIFNPPALIIDGNILVEGYVPTLEEMIRMLNSVVSQWILYHILHLFFLQ